MLRLRVLARQRGLTIIVEQPRSASRVHDGHELRQALLVRSELILVSPIHPTRSHPDWKPLPRMRAATLAGLAGRRAVALGGMNARRYAKIAPLGFIAWAGISAFRT
jgi:thiamine-phosphate pyrophosphorylase